MMLDVPARQPPVTLDVYQLAVLAGGAHRACETAAVALVDRGLARAVPGNAQDGRLLAQGDLPPGASAAEAAVHAAASQANAPALFGALHDFHLRAARDRERAGKLNERQRRITGKVASKGPLGPQFPGASPANLRRAAQVPVQEIWQQLCQAGLARTGWRARRATTAGRRALADARRDHQDLRSPAGAVAQPALAVALWGVQVLAGTRLQAVAGTFRPEIPVGAS